MVTKPFAKPTKAYPLTSTLSPSTNISTTSSTSLANFTTTPIPMINSTAEVEDHEAIGMQSHMLFLFSTVLLFVAVAIIVKIIISSKNGRGRGSVLDGWRLSTSRNSGQTGRLGLGGGPAMGISNGEATRGGGLSLSSTTASYTAMPTSAAAASSMDHMETVPQLQEARLDWERQFFDDDDEEHLASNMEEEPRVR